jgi:hypothetical protein
MVVDQIPLGQILDPDRLGSREEHGLGAVIARRHALHEVLNVICKTLVEHLVRLIQHLQRERERERERDGERERFQQLPPSSHSRF